MRRELGSEANPKGQKLLFLQQISYLYHSHLGQAHQAALSAIPITVFDPKV
jgi:hypothetical protein